jgi:hypothetical protein
MLEMTTPLFPTTFPAKSLGIHILVLTSPEMNSSELRSDWRCFGCEFAMMTANCSLLSNCPVFCNFDLWQGLFSAQNSKGIRGVDADQQTIEWLSDG